MNEHEIKEYLKTRGCPLAVWQGGSPRLLRKWGEFVAHVEKGYCPRCSVDEYWNELDTREMIHETGLDSAVEDLDTRLRKMLVATHIRHRYKERTSNYDFWNYGYPKNATGFFRSHIKSFLEEDENGTA